MNPSLAKLAVIYLSFVLSMLLSILPIPDSAAMFSPPWPLLTLLYWCLALPQKINMGTAWIVGFLMDVLTGSLLGLHALTYALAAYLSYKNYPQLRNSPNWQQAVAVFFFLALTQSFTLWLKHASNPFAFGIICWAPALTGALCWPVTFKVLRRTRRHYRIQ